MTPNPTKLRETSKKNVIPKAINQEPQKNVVEQKVELPNKVVKIVEEKSVEENPKKDVETHQDQQLEETRQQNEKDHSNIEREEHSFHSYEEHSSHDHSHDFSGDDIDDEPPFDVDQLKEEISTHFKDLITKSNIEQQNYFKDYLEN